MKIAVEGCCHGELDKIYETLEFLEQQNNIKVDLLLICGDFQSVRNQSDLQAMAVPHKYLKMNTFYKYYSGEKKAPVLTVFIGGNHEASNYLQELPYGGWVAPNIYYMGYANVLNFGGIRIGGISGIFKGKDFNRGHFEHPPYNDDTKRSAYHVRNLDVFRMKQLSGQIDIMFSHDWPRGIYNHGNVNNLLHYKKFLRSEVQSNTLGSPPNEELLAELKPDYWFSAHLHVKFAAVVNHQLADGTSKATKFLSLDKCLPRRKFLQVLDFPSDASQPLKLQLDVEWLAILKSTNHLLNLTKVCTYMPGRGCKDRYDFTPTEAEKAAIIADFGGEYSVPLNFEQTADVHVPMPKTKGKKERAPPPQMAINPQTDLLCKMLDLTNPFAVFRGVQTHSTDVLNISCSVSDLDDSAMQDEGMPSDDDDQPTFIDSTLDFDSFNSTFNTSTNPDEISLDDSPDDEGNDDDMEVAHPVLANLAQEQCETEMSVSICVPKTSSPMEDRVDDIPDPLPQGSASDFTASDGEKSDSSDKIEESTSSSPTPSSPTKSLYKSPLGKRASPKSQTDSTASASDSLNEASESSESPLKTKRFKRRNQSFYSSTEEENV